MHNRSDYHKYIKLLINQNINKYDFCWKRLHSFYNLNDKEFILTANLITGENKNDKDEAFDSLIKYVDYFQKIIGQDESLSNDKYRIFLDTCIKVDANNLKIIDNIY